MGENGCMVPLCVDPHVPHGRTVLHDAPSGLAPPDKADRHLTAGTRRYHHFQLCTATKALNLSLGPKSGPDDKNDLGDLSARFIN